MSFTIDDAHAIVRSIDFEHITKHPNILIAARFWDDERYHAAKVCYQYMRYIDDLVDTRKSRPDPIGPSDYRRLSHDIRSWLRMMTDAQIRKPADRELLQVIRKFAIPLWPMEEFAKSMLFDIGNNGFATLDDFLTYSQGASVAPASIFVHLNGLTTRNGRFLPPEFDVRKAAIPCALFSYLVHIIRDFQKDQQENLNYFSDDMLEKHKLTRTMLRGMADGDDICDGFRNMIAEYHDLADHYRQETGNVMHQIRPYLQPRYQLSLEIIFNLYLMVFERIHPRHGPFHTAALNPEPHEIRDRVLTTIAHFFEEE